MSSTFVYSAHSNSRLIALLCELLEIDEEIPHQHFIAKLSKLIDFSGAIALSASLAISPKPQGTKKLTRQSQPLSLSDVLINARKTMLDFIMQSFAVGERSGQSFYWPVPSDRHFSHEDNGLTSYRHFYGLHQSEMELRVTQLLKKIRPYLSMHSPKRARLAAMDETFQGIMADHNRRAFAVIPHLLSQRFHTLLSQQAQVGESVVVNQLIAEMRSVLLAELDIRLKPALGLVESLVSTDSINQEEEKIL